MGFTVGKKYRIMSEELSRITRCDTSIGDIITCTAVDRAGDAWSNEVTYNGELGSDLSDHLISCFTGLPQNVTGWCFASPRHLDDGLVEEVEETQQSTKEYLESICVDTKDLDRDTIERLEKAFLTTGCEDLTTKSWGRDERCTKLLIDADNTMCYFEGHYKYILTTPEEVFNKVFGEPETPPTPLNKVDQGCWIETDGMSEATRKRVEDIFVAKFGMTYSNLQEGSSDRTKLFAGNGQGAYYHKTVYQSEYEVTLEDVLASVEESPETNVGTLNILINEYFAKNGTQSLAEFLDGHGVKVQSES